MKRGTPKHPKMYALCSLLKCRRPTAIGYLEMLWHMTAEYTPQGNIGKYSDDWIEASLEWSGRKGHLIDCLVKSGWLDYEGLTIYDPLPTDSEWAGHRKLFVHDWHDHADSAVVKRLQRLALPFLKFTPKVTGKFQSVTGQCPPSRAPLPEPFPSLPEPQPHPANGTTAKFPAQEEFPTILAEIRKHDAAADDHFARRLMQTVVQSALSNPKFPPAMATELTDANVARCVAESYRTGPKNHGTGLLLSRVPNIVLTWSLED